ncbi:protein YgfX [Shewanella woodyi]|uniref:protein YgfX n=1 Tax=Shewanella woodyi TaxID=60961 RepID=UPI003747E805
MEETQHSFNLTSSFDQRFSLVVFASLCLTSFLAWPLLDSLLYHLIKALFFSFMLLFFIHQFLQLKSWHCQFVLNGAGEGRLQGEERFKLTQKAFVSPFICLFYIEADEKLTLMIVWSDMCDDTSYRNLCRLLLASKG